MSAFNEIVFQARCPACSADTTVRAQTYVASSFDGDERGRFCGHDYRLGSRMLWWPTGHKDYDAWRSADTTVSDPQDRQVVSEACYATCTRCNAELVAVVRFRMIVPIAVDYLASVTQWPPGFSQ